MAKKKINTNPVLVVIPYLPSGAEGNELELAITGWGKHFKEDHIIVVVGEGLPKISGKDVVCIESPRVEGKADMYRQHLDYVSCFRKVREKFPEQDGFIFVADDCYAVRDFTLDDVKAPKYLFEEVGARPYDTGWLHDKFRTMMLLIKEGQQIRDYSTHLPQWFEWDKLFSLYEKYDMDNNSFVFEDLYYNIYIGTGEAQKLDYNGAPYAQYLNDNSQGLHEALVDIGISTKFWLQNVAGMFTPYLKEKLTEHYN